MFTRRHYQFVADEVGKMYPYETNGEFWRVVNEWSRAFKRDNPRFDPDRFERAAERSRRWHHGPRSNHSYMYGHESEHRDTETT